MQSTGSRNRALLGFAVVILLLTWGMVFAIRRLDHLALVDVARIKAKEHEITSVEHLRWSGELVVSLGRGYLISGDPAFRKSLEHALVDFDETLHELRRAELMGPGEQLVGEAEEAARAFWNIQDEVLALRNDGVASDELERRFELEMVPRHERLAASLGRLVAHKEDLIAHVYDDSARDRARLAGWMFGLLGVLVLTSVGVAWQFGNLLEQSHRATKDALGAARKATAARDELMGIVAHDLRNPLGAIMMRAALMKREADSERTRQHTESIENVARRMEHLIKTMLDVATIEAGKFTVRASPCDVEDLLRETLDMFGGLFASKDVRLELKAKDAGLNVQADRDRVLQVLSNLLGNALKFVPAGGKVQLAVERQAEMARFTVSDTGPGISSENVARLFDRFWKDDTAEKGTGLGLFIAKGIVEAHGGEIWATSAIGRGATFSFTIRSVPSSSSACARGIEVRRR